MFGFVIINGENDYTVNVDLNSFGSGYNVVSKDIDPSNAYNIEEVRAYCDEHPDKVLSEHPLHVRTALEREIESLTAYLANTDYMAIKCGELGMSMSSTYPNEYMERIKARARINEIETLLDSFGK
mgnify:CR=1 FL=1